jgi:hypothetical protein
MESHCIFCHMNVSQQKLIIIFFFVTQMRSILVPISVANITDHMSRLNGVVCEDLYGESSVFIASDVPEW